MIETQGNVVARAHIIIYYIKRAGTSLLPLLEKGGKVVREKVILS